MLRGFLNTSFAAQIKLKTQPKPGVVYTAHFSGPSAGPSEVSLPAFPLSFDHANWNVPQDLSITGHRFGTIAINYTLEVNYTGKKKASSFDVFIDDILPNTVIATDAGYLTASDITVGPLSFLLIGSYFTIQSQATGGIRPNVSAVFDSSSGDGAFFFVHSKPDGTIASGFPTVNADGTWTVYVCHYPSVSVGSGAAPSAIGSYNVGITVKITDPLSGTVMSSDSIVNNVSCGAVFNEVGFNSGGSHVTVNAGTGYAYSDVYTDVFCQLVQGPNVWSTSDTSSAAFTPLPYTSGSIATPSVSTGSTASVSIAFNFPIPPPHTSAGSISFSGGKGGIHVLFSGTVLGTVGISSPLYTIITPAVP